MPADADLKIPGYFGAWAARYLWCERVAVWDAYFDGLALTRHDAQLEAARQQTVAQAEELQGMIDNEFEALRKQFDRERGLPGDPVYKSATLAQLATALKEASAARLMALGGGGADYE